MAIAAKVEPVDGAAVPEEGAAVLAAGPIGAAVVAVAREELGEDGAEAAVPGGLGDVGAEEGESAAGGGRRGRRRGAAVGGEEGAEGGEEEEAVEKFGEGGEG